jgi:transcription antitermination factor NusG
MKGWFLMQTFYHGLTQKSREQLDASAEGSFMSLILGKVECLVEKIVTNQSWTYNVQACKQSEEISEEVYALSIDMSMLLNWLEQHASYKRDHQAIQDAFNARNKCGEYLGVEFVDSPEDINTIINNSASQQQ